MQPSDVSHTSSSSSSRHHTSSTWGDHNCQDRDRISKIALHHVGYTKIPTNMVQYFLDGPHCNIPQAGVKELGVPRESNPGAWRHVGRTSTGQRHGTTYHNMETMVPMINFTNTPQAHQRSQACSQRITQKPLPNNIWCRSPLRVHDGLRIPCCRPQDLGFSQMR